MIFEKSTKTPIAFEADVCVIGGSCTGVFAAVRAARRGLRVALVEQNVIFGGMATAALVNEWHSLCDTDGETQIIGGLTSETLDRLRKRNAVLHTLKTPDTRYRFNSAELALELDEFVQEHETIRPFLSSRCVTGIRKNNRISAAIIEDKSGRRAITASIYIDASGDGDLLRRAGFPAWKNPVLQPVSCQQLVAGLEVIAGRNKHKIWDRIRHLAGEFAYPRDNAAPWFFEYPSSGEITNIFGARLNEVDASDADQLTAALMEGRRQHRALLDMIRAAISTEICAVAHAHALGVRETWHAHCWHQLTGQEVLNGEDFPDAIASGTYPIDIHSPEGTILRYLDGTEKIIGRNGSIIHGWWKEKSEKLPKYYQIPFRSIVPLESENLLVAGRLLDADREAFGGVRVMVNMNQVGEAAGEAAALAVQQNGSIAKVDFSDLRNALRQGGSLIPDERGDGEVTIGEIPLRQRQKHD